MLRDREIDVIHTHASRAHFFGVLLRGATGISVVATAHAHRLQGHWAFNDHVITLSAAGDRFQRWNLVRRSHRSVVHQFVDVDRFAPPDAAERLVARGSIGVDPGVPVVGYVGSLFREKGVQDAIAAWRRVADAVPAARFVIAGDGPADFVRQLQTAVAAHASPDRVRWLGRRSDIPRVMSAIDVLVLPSHDEAAPIVALEALAAGVPVVATRVGGTPEYVADGETGVLVPSGDRKALSDALILLLSDDGLRAQYGRRARLHVVERFSLARQAARVEAVLARAAARDPRARASKG